MTRFACITMLMCALGLAGITAAETGTKQAPAKTLKLVPRLAVGDRFVLEITKSRTQTGRPSMGRTKGFQVVDVEIVSSSGKNTLLSWTPRRTGVIGPDGKPASLPPQMAGLATMYDGVQMLFELSPECELLGLKNFEQIRPLMTKAIDKILAAMSKSPQETAKLRQGMATMLGSRKMIEQICSKEITLLLALARLELDGEGANEFDYQLPTPFGEGVIPAKLVVKVTDLDRAAGRATVTMNTKMDPKKAAKAMLALMQAMTRKMGKPAPTEKDIPEMEIRDKSTYVVDLKTNLPLSAEHTRTVAVDRKKRVDTVKIVRKPARANIWPPQSRSIPKFRISIFRWAGFNSVPAGSATQSVRIGALLNSIRTSWRHSTIWPGYTRRIQMKISATISRPYCSPNVHVKSRATRRRRNWIRSPPPSPQSDGSPKPWKRRAKRRILPTRPTIPIWPSASEAA